MLDIYEVVRQLCKVEFNRAFRGVKVNGLWFKWYKLQKQIELFCIGPLVKAC